VSDWTLDALCAQVDPELFFPEKSVNANGAKKVCRRCTVSAACLAYALDYETGEYGTLIGELTGIYGGLSPRERRRIIRSGPVVA
jgi:WhiB family redox-sensing transcriptional regulator